MNLTRDDFEITWNIIEENPKNIIQSVYPNPVNDRLNIAVENIEPDKSRVQIFDMYGIKHFDCNIDRKGNLITIDTGNLSSGTYVYQVVSNDKVIRSGKFIKQ